MVKYSNMVILGIDPGLATIGYGLIKSASSGPSKPFRGGFLKTGLNPIRKGDRLYSSLPQEVGFSNGVNKKGASKNGFRCLDYGTIKTDPSLALAERLKKLYLETSRLLRKYEPTALAIEEVFFFKNLKTAMPVSRATGVILLAAAKQKTPTYEFSPLQIKMAIVGYGRAEKKQMQRMVKSVLSLPEIPKPDDAADALAVAICCATLLEKKSLLAWRSKSSPTEGC